MGTTVWRDPTLMSPTRTVFLPLRPKPVASEPGGVTSGPVVALEVWTGLGPPPAAPPPGAEAGDTWIDVASGDVFVLTPEE